MGWCPKSDCSGLWALGSGLGAFTVLIVATSGAVRLVVPALLECAVLHLRLEVLACLLAFACQVLLLFTAVRAS
jgi:hypothetical protein